MIFMGEGFVIYSGRQGAGCTQQLSGLRRAAPNSVTNQLFGLRQCISSPLSISFSISNMGRVMLCPQPTLEVHCKDKVGWF